MLETGLITLEYVNTVIKERPREIHKGQCGRVLIIAGSRGMAGAAVLSAGGALRSGAGLVSVALSEELFPIVQTAVPQATCKCISDSDFLRSFDRYDAIAVGPGIGVDEKNYLLIETLLREYRGPVVIDADGITCLCRYGRRLEILTECSADHDIILTPHPGEADRLLDSLGESKIDQAGRINAAETISAATGAVVLLKGAGTVVTMKGRGTYTNTTGNPGMATGGSGDVLTGVIAAIAASGADAFDAARTGAFIHGMAGDLAAERLGQWGMTSLDIVDSLPAAFKAIVGK